MNKSTYGNMKTGQIYDGFVKAMFRQSFYKVGTNKIVVSFNIDGIWKREIKGWYEKCLGCYVLDRKI